MVNVMDWGEWTRNFKFRRWQFNSYTFIMCSWLQYLWRCQCPCVCTCPNIPTPRAGSEHVHHKSNPSWTSGVSVGFRNAVALGPKQNLANVAKLWYYGPMWVKTAVPDSWRRAAEPLCTRASLQSVLKALELLAPGNDNSGLKLQHLLKLQERPGSAAQSRSGECEGLWRSIRRSVYVCWPGVKNKRFHSGNFHPEAGCWKLLPELCYWWDAKASCVVPARAQGGTCDTVSHLGSHNANDVFTWDTCSTQERLTDRKCRSFIACLFWEQTAGKGGKGGATTEMGPGAFCSLLSPRLRCSVLEENKEDVSLSEH